MGTNGHATADLFNVPQLSSDQQTLVSKINELQDAIGHVRELGAAVVELASRVILASNVPEPQKKPHAIKIALTYFDTAHKKRFIDQQTGEPIPAKIDGGKDATLMKRLLDTYGAERVESLIDQFFALDDDWLNQKTGYTVAAFSNRVPALISTASTPPKVAGLTRNTSNNARNLAVAGQMIRNSYNR